MAGRGSYTSGTSTWPLPPYSKSLQVALKQLDQLINWERSVRAGPRGSARLMRVDKKPSLDLLHRLGFSPKQTRFVHITGSKGKGTVGALIAAALQLPPFHSPKEGPVALYSSPHVERITERIRFNGSPIADDDFAHSLNAALVARKRPPELSSATWFDVMTASAMDSFRRAGVSRAVVEVGMGGRLDSTNVLNAPVSVITNVMLEHSDIIGPTLRDIAIEKAGIIAPGAQVVLGLPKTHPLSEVFRAEAKRVDPNAFIIYCPPLPGERLFRTNLRLAREGLRAVARLESLSTNDTQNLLSEQFAKNALSSLPGRQELFPVVHESTGRKVGVLLDGAHVPLSVATVLAESPWPRPVVVLGLSTGKDIDGICNVVASHARHVIATSVGDDEFYIPADQTARSARFAGALVCETISDCNDAIYRAIHAAAKSRTGIVVLGSLHLAGRIRPLLRQMSANYKDENHFCPQEAT